MGYDDEGQTPGSRSLTDAKIVSRLAKGSDFMEPPRKPKECLDESILMCRHSCIAPFPDQSWRCYELLLSILQARRCDYTILSLVQC
jgi:hypothetical protein